jgi:hypothetical protein
MDAAACDRDLGISAPGGEGLSEQPCDAFFVAHAFN